MPTTAVLLIDCPDRRGLVAAIANFLVEGYDAVLGLRYVNFTAAYDVPGHPLSDRNAALLPTTL